MQTSKGLFLCISVLLPLYAFASYAACNSGETCKYILKAEIQKNTFTGLYHLFKDLNCANQDAVETLQKSLNSDDERSEELNKLLEDLKVQEIALEKLNTNFKEIADETDKYWKKINDLNTENVDFSMVELRHLRALANTENEILAGWKHNRLNEFKELPGYDTLDAEIENTIIDENNVKQQLPLLSRIYDFIVFKNSPEYEVLQEEQEKF